jgi:hypothetical protein
LFEADPRHAAVLKQQMGIKEGSNGLSTPGVLVRLTPALD